MKPFKTAGPHFFVSIVLQFVLITTGLAQTSNISSHLSEGRQSLEDSDFKNARDAFEQALELDGSSVEALIGISRVELEERDWQNARSRIDEALELAPDLLHGHYLRAIANREIAKFRTFNQERYWHDAQADLEFILARDSAYKDVLVQYALWYRYQDQYREAVEMGRLQHQIKPDSTALEFELIRLYQYLLRHENSPATLDWLTAHGTPLDQYFSGEVLRRQGELIKADDIFSDLLFKEADIFPQLPLLSRARVYYQQQAEKIAQSYVDKAVQAIENPTQARLLLDEIKHIITDPELDLFNSLSTPEEYAAFFEAFWFKRDPMPARPVNVRMTEHYNRLLVAEKQYAYDGFRLWHNDPDRLGALKFPKSYQLNEEFNDKGLIYIRHGEPYDREVQVGGDLEYRSVIDNTNTYGAPVEYSTKQGWQPNESWRYNVPRRMDFHFVLAEGGKNAWRLIPSITNLDILTSREHWGPLYYQMAEAARGLAEIGQLAAPRPPIDATVSALDEEAQALFAGREDSLITTSTSARSMNMGYMSSNNRKFLEFSSLERDMVDESTEAVELALSTDQHTWDEKIEAIPMPYQLATFRGRGDSTRVDIYFAMPIGQVTKALKDARKTIEVEMGYAFHDTTWHQVLRYAEAKRLPTHQEETAAIIDFFTFSAPADTYNVSLFSNPLQTMQQSGFKFPYRVPSYGLYDLDMSDLLMADYIGPAQSDSRFDRGDLHVSPNPFHRYATNQPVFVYFEVYNLAFGADERTNFGIEYILGTAGDQKKGLFRRKDRAILTLQVDRNTDTRSPIEYAEIDVSKVDPGDYTLTIRVTDIISGAVIEKSREIALFDAN